MSQDIKIFLYKLFVVKFIENKMFYIQKSPTTLRFGNKRKNRKCCSNFPSAALFSVRVLVKSRFKQTFCTYFRFLLHMNNTGHQKIR